MNLESLGLDTLSKTETSKQRIISKHGLVVQKIRYFTVINRLVDLHFGQGPWVEYQSP